MGGPKGPTSVSTSKLMTRDGRELGGIGSWEREQLANLPKTALDRLETKNLNHMGAKVKDPIRKYIIRPPRKHPAWWVKISRFGEYVCSKSFKDEDYGGEAQALEAATKFRDEQLKVFGMRLKV